MADHQPDPVTRKHPNRPFAIATIILVLLFLAGLTGMAVWMTWEMGEFNPQAIFSRITGKEVAFQLTDMPETENEQAVIQETTTLTQPSQVEDTSESVPVDDQPTAKPTPEVIQATRTPIPTPTPTLSVALATTETNLEASGSPTDQSTTSSSGSTTETVSETSTGSTQLPTTSELPNTGFMDEVGLPILALWGAILFLAVLLVKYLRTSL